MRRLFLLIMFISFCTVAFCQTAVNQKDSKGSKQGRWIYSSPAVKNECSYRDGKLHGISLFYSTQTKRILFVGEYNDGECCGTWYAFHEKGYPEWKLYNISKYDSVYSKQGYAKNYKPQHSAIRVNYYPDGMKKSEGRILFDNDPIEDQIEFGTWYYYDKKGDLIKTIIK